ncbi:MAG: sulfurtransferase complex subunit TusC [Kangiella sp.]|nr:MAG: sulfurtransferase complex subunit TusC [Kangiella sp.]
MNQSKTHNSNPMINIVIHQTALTNASFKESIDLALVCAAFDQKVNLIFVDNGVYNLMTKQNYQSIGDKNHLDILKGLEFYDIENIYVEEESLENRKISKNKLIESCKILSINEIKRLHEKSNQVVSL